MLMRTPQMRLLAKLRSKNNRAEFYGTKFSQAIGDYFSFSPVIFVIVSRSFAYEKYNEQKHCK